MILFISDNMEEIELMIVTFSIPIDSLSNWKKS